MSQLDLHISTTTKAPPHTHSKNTDVPIVAKLSEAYKLWHGYLNHLPRLTRYTLGVKIDNQFTLCLEQALLASYASRIEKPIVIERLSISLDSLKFFLKVLWELKGIDNKKYTVLSIPLQEIGKMIGGWQKFFKKETPSM